MAAETPHPGPQRSATPHDAGPDAGQPGRARHRTPLWAVFPVAVVAWFVGLVPWLLLRSRVGTFGTPWNPRNDVRDALLPFVDDRLSLLLTLTLAGGVLAGLAPLVRGTARGQRPASVGLVVLGAALAATIAVLQTLAPEPDLGGSTTQAGTVRLAFVALTAAGTVAGVVLGLLVSLGGPALRVMAAAPAVLVLAGWAGQLALSVRSDSDPAGVPAWVSPGMTIIAAIVVGLLLTRLGLGSAGRVVAWAATAFLLVATPAVLTTARYLLEALPRTPLRVDAVTELVVDGLALLRLATAQNLTVVALWTPAALALLALAVGGLGAVLLRGRPDRVSATRRSSRG